MREKNNERNGTIKRMRAGEESREMPVAIDEERMDMDQDEKGGMSDVESESSSSSSSSSSEDSSLSRGMSGLWRARSNAGTSSLDRKS